MQPDKIPGNSHSDLCRRDFLKYAAGGVAAGALGANAARDARAQAILKADRSLLTSYPTLTGATKDWRWNRIRSMMAEPLRRAGAWQMSPLIHTLNPTDSVTIITEGILGPRGYPGVRERFAGVELRELGEDRGDLVLEAGMAFQIEPNAAFERTFVNTGGSLMLHADGTEELNPICANVIELDV